MSYSGLDKIPMDTAIALRRLHGSLALFHGLQALLVVVLAEVQLGDKGRAPVYLTTWQRPEDGTGWTAHHGELASAVPLAYFVATFLFLASLDHAITAWYAFGHYLTCVESRYNPFRWCEYLFSFSTMSLLICVLCGGLDLWVLALVAVLSMATIAFGWVGEAYPMVPLQYVGWVPFALLWVVLFTLFGLSPGNPPAFVWAIMFTLFVLTACFGVVPFWGAGRKYLDTEYAFCVMSLLAKTMLAWLTVGGVMSL